MGRFQRKGLKSRQLAKYRRIRKDFVFLINQVTGNQLINQVTGNKIIN